jgi:F-type H+-transporting ATPase subunit b
MQQTIQDLADLVLGALPTTLLVAVLALLLNAILFGPILKILAERDAATKGAVEQAKLALARAEQKAAEYETALRAARGEILRLQDQQRQQLREQQAAAVASARATASEQIAAAKRDLDAQAATARQSLREEAEKLSTEITRAVLEGSRN